jgi:menaquinol-cytochrome c reductase iron-sulfur subunit
MSGPLPHRRRFLSVCTAGLIALMSGLIFAPVAAFVGSPLRRRSANPAGGDFSDAGAIDAIPSATWTLLPIEIVRQDGWDKTKQSRSVWVFVSRTAPGIDVKVLSPICPHLGCPTAWLAAKSEFLCPCHGSIFSKDGSFLSGPSPRGLDSLESQIRDGHLWVRWQDFRIGMKEPVAVQV